MKLLRLLPAAAIVIAAAASGCSGGYGDPNGPDSLKISAARVPLKFGANSQPGFVDNALSLTSKKLLPVSVIRTVSLR